MQHMIKPRTLLYTHPSCFEHDTGPDHPECSERLHVIINALKKADLQGIEWRIAHEATRDDLERVHDHKYLRHIARIIPEIGLWNIDSDTIISSSSFVAAKHAAGAVCAAVDAVIEGDAENAFCVVRPPGHHAEIRHALGFCIINNIAVGAMRARAVHGYSRIAILDIDAHHGNGAQNIFWDDPSILTASIHRWPTDLITGDADECGSHGQVSNLLLPSGADGAMLRQLVTTQLLPKVYDFKPELILVAAGFDGHSCDPLIDLAFTSQDFAWLGEVFSVLAKDCCNNRLVASLEGGYHLESLGKSVVNFVRAMQNHEDMI